jgi:hypothetical protein
VIHSVEGVVAFVSRRSKSKPKTVERDIPGRAQLGALFGPPLLLEGEDAAAYDELLARVYAAVQPLNIIEEILINDFVFLEWEVLRWRRLKWSVMQATRRKALENFLVKQLESNYALHEEHFKHYLAEILQNNLPEDQVDSAEMLAAECAPNTAAAGEKLNKLLRRIGLELSTVLRDAQVRRAEELVREYEQLEPDAVSLIDELLTGAGLSRDALLADALGKTFNQAEKLDYIERLDRLTTTAESRRNASLHEIERHRAVLGEMLRRRVVEIEEDELKVIETTPAKRKNAA